jgi:hypothetical protein
LIIANLDGPTVDVRINGQVIATVECQRHTSLLVPQLTPGPLLPLPWHVEVFLKTGIQILAVDEFGDRGSRTIIVRGDEAAEFASEDASGGPIPSGDCLIN